MTRDEAACILQNRHWNNPLAFVDSLEALGLLKFETPADKDRIAAINYLSLHGYPYLAEIIIAVLERGGFKITREST